MNVIFINKYNKFLKKLNRYKKPIIKMQAIVKGRLVYNSYRLIKKSVIIIQKQFRNYLKRKYFLISRWLDYKKYIYYDERYKLR